MDLIAMRFEARHLEVEGKLPEALEICRDILRHFAHEPPNEQIVPVFVQASEISIKLGDREGGATLLLLAAERYADAGLARPVIDLYQRLRRLGPARKGLDLQFARRMLEHRHPGAAREFLADLARRQKKEKLQATLERMAAWSDDKMQQQLRDFLDRAEGIRVSTTQPVVTVATTPPTPAPAPPKAQPPPADRVTAPRRGIPAPPESVPPAPSTRVPATPLKPRDSAAGGVMPADAVVFVMPSAPAPDRQAGPTAARPPLVPPPPKRRRRSRAGPAAMIAAAFVALVAGAVFLVPRIPRDLATRAAPLPPPVADVAAAPTAASLFAADSAVTLAAADSLVRAAGADSGRRVVEDPAQRDTRATVVPPPPAAAAAVPVTTQAAPPPRPSADTARPLPAAPAPAAQAAAAPPPSPSPAGVDYPVVMVEGLEVLGISREGEGSTRRILVRQLLPSGDTLDLRESDLGEASVGVGVGRVLVSRHPSGGAMGTVRVGRYLVNARAPVAPEVLEPLLQKLIEKAPG